MKKDIIAKLFATFTAHNPSPNTELHYRSDFELLCAVVLSAQTTDIAVNKVTPALFELAPTPEAMAQLDVQIIEQHIASIGLYHSKAKYLKQLSQELVTRFASKVPQTEKELTSLSGVGIKTARVVLNTIFDHHVIAVDTHIFRVAKRLGLSSSPTPNKMSNHLARIIPKEYLKNAHHHLILHGRYICTARAPKCDLCPVAEFCKMYNTRKKKEAKSH